MTAFIITIFIIVVVVGVGLTFWLMMVQNSLREQKNYERGLKMIPMLIHLPPASDDLGGGNNGSGRDQRDILDEVLSQAQSMYNIISSTATNGFKSKLYGQRHISFEIVARDGLVYYYAVVPIVLVEVIKQAVAAAYPSARLQEVEEHNVFSKVGHASGTIGAYFPFTTFFELPIST